MEQCCTNENKWNTRQRHRETLLHEQKMWVQDENETKRCLELWPLSQLFFFFGRSSRQKVNFWYIHRHGKSNRHIKKTHWILIQKTCICIVIPPKSRNVSLELSLNIDCTPDFFTQKKRIIFSYSELCIERGF